MRSIVEIARRLWFWLGMTGAAIFLFAPVSSCTKNDSQISQGVGSSRGALVIVGGGGTPDDVVKRAIALAGGDEAPVVILPQASQRAEAGEESAEMFRKAGAKHVRALSLEEATIGDDRALIDKALLIWFPGGDQNRLMKRLYDAGLVESIRERQRTGAVVGGTSAGAAVMGEVMIKGGAELKAIQRGGTPVDVGLGLWPEAIVDQHFLRRQRFNRLLSAVMERPTLVGVGIDEKTAVIVRDGSFEVMGDSSVIVIDARTAKMPPLKDAPSALLSAEGLRLHVVEPGQRFSIVP